MSAQDKTEQVLRDIHILFSNSEAYSEEKNLVIVDKKQMLEQLNRLNVCIYEMMEEYELTQQGRDKAEREMKKVGEEIIKDASRKAEDVYAASVIYTDEALHHVQEIMQNATDSVRELYDKLNEELKAEKKIVARDQSELKGHLQNLVDTEKYLKLIDERNRELEKERVKENEESEPSPYAAVKPEIKINTEYFEKTGITPLEDDTDEEAFSEDDFEIEIIAPEVSVNLDADYFKWKEGQDPAPTEKKASLFAKLYKGGK